MEAGADAETVTGTGTAGQGRLADLYRRYATEATALAYALTGSREAAEDIMQEAFVRVARRLGHLRDEADFWPYLRRTVVNVATSRYRRRRVELRYLEKEAALARPAEAPVQDLDAEQSLRAAVLHLPARQRAVIVLRYFEDLPEREIAEILSCRVGAVKTLLHRAMTTLRSEIER